MTDDGRPTTLAYRPDLLAKRASSIVRFGRQTTDDPGRSPALAQEIREEKVR
jgi:hypothetical protein